MTRDELIEAMARAMDIAAFEVLALHPCTRLADMALPRVEAARKNATAALSAIEAAGCVVMPKEPDFYWDANSCDDGESGTDNPLNIVDSYDLLEPVEMITGFDGPRLWGVGHEDDDGGFYCTTFRSLEDAERSHDRRRDRSDARPRCVEIRRPGWRP